MNKIRRAICKVLCGVHPEYYISLREYRKAEENRRILYELRSAGLPIDPQNVVFDLAKRIGVDAVIDLWRSNVQQPDYTKSMEALRKTLEEENRK